MTDDERSVLIAECYRREAAGLLMPIVVRRKKPPTGRRVRIAPGLMGEPATWHEDGRLVCYVDPGKLRRLLSATVTVAPRPA